MSDKKITPLLLKALREDIDAALKSVAEKHGLESLHAGTASYSPQAGSFHFKLEGLVAGGKTPEAERYEMNMSFLHLPPLGSTVKLKQGEAKIVGLNTTGNKVIVETDDKRYIVPVS